MPEGVGYSSNSVQTRATPAAKVEARAPVDAPNVVQTRGDAFKDKVEIELSARQQQTPVNTGRSTYEQIGQSRIKVEARAAEQKAVEQLRQRQTLSTQRDDQVTRASVEANADRREDRAQRQQTPNDRSTSDALAVRVQQQSFTSAEKSSY